MFITVQTICMTGKQNRAHLEGGIGRCVSFTRDACLLSTVAGYHKYNHVRKQVMCDPRKNVGWRYEATHRDGEASTCYAA
jgi:hypothetical protein